MLKAGWGIHTRVIALVYSLRAGVSEPTPTIPRRGGAPMKAQEIMTTQPACCTPDVSVQEAAQLMERHHCGCILVVDDPAINHLVGTVTDRDIALRAVAQGKGADTKVSGVMSSDPSCCAPNDDIRAVERIMTERQVRRVPVVDERGCCVGIIAQADLTRKEPAVSDREVGHIVERISEPGDEPRTQADVGIRPR